MARKTDRWPKCQLYISLCRERDIENRQEFDGSSRARSNSPRRRTIHVGQCMLMDKFILLNYIEVLGSLLRTLPDEMWSFEEWKIVYPPPLFERASLFVALRKDLLISAESSQESCCRFPSLSFASDPKIVRQVRSMVERLAQCTTHKTHFLIDDSKIEFMLIFVHVVETSIYRLTTFSIAAHNMYLYAFCLIIGIHKTEVKQKQPTTSKNNRKMMRVIKLLFQLFAAVYPISDINKFKFFSVAVVVECHKKICQKSTDVQCERERDSFVVITRPSQAACDYLKYEICQLNERLTGGVAITREQEATMDLTMRNEIMRTESLNVSMIA